jgi:hypothetical protein
MPPCRLPRVDAAVDAAGQGTVLFWRARRETSMRDAERDHARDLLQEAFTAGWQAALAVRITNPRVLAVVESCFEMWLEDAADEVDVLGLMFRGRDDLPRPVRHTTSTLRGYRDEPGGAPHRARPAAASAVGRRE